MTGPQLRHVGLRLDQSDVLDPDEAETGIFGFWIFLMSDAVLFALLFAVYGTQLAATAGAPGPAAEFKLGSAFWETVVLLTSSFTFGMAVTGHEVRADRGSLLVVMLVATLALGVLFVGMELHDFATMFSDGAVPSAVVFCPPSSPWCRRTACM